MGTSIHPLIDQGHGAQDPLGIPACSQGDQGHGAHDPFDVPACSQGEGGHTQGEGERHPSSRDRLYYELTTNYKLRRVREGEVEGGQG